MQRRMDAGTMNAAILLIMKTASPVNSPSNQRNACGINAARLISREEGKNRFGIHFKLKPMRTELFATIRNFNFPRNRTFLLGRSGINVTFY